MDTSTRKNRACSKKGNRSNQNTEKIKREIKHQKQNACKAPKYSPNRHGKNDGLTA
ncbi:hypothetical protein R50073_26780 [Maricurvus nonylphenolicus]